MSTRIRPLYILSHVRFLRWPMSGSTAKRAGDGQERAVNEQQLAKTASQTSAQGSMVDMQQDAQRIRNARAAERTRVVAKRPNQIKSLGRDASR